MRGACVDRPSVLCVCMGRWQKEGVWEVVCHVVQVHGGSRCGWWAGMWGRLAVCSVVAGVCVCVCCSGVVCAVAAFLGMCVRQRVQCSWRAGGRLIVSNENGMKKQKDKGMAGSRRHQRQEGGEESFAATPWHIEIMYRRKLAMLVGGGDGGQCSIKCKM